MYIFRKKCPKVKKPFIFSLHDYLLQFCTKNKNQSTKKTCNVKKKNSKYTKLAVKTKQS